MNFLLSFDVEDWFQVENFRGAIDRSLWEHWDRKESRVVGNTLKLLELLDRHGIKATFFVLAWIAERHPELVREVSSCGMEVASHGYAHELTYGMTEEELKEDLRRSKGILEDITGKEVLGYRAPSFSITQEVSELVREVGYRYDSSYNPFTGNKRYGSVDLLVRDGRGFYRIGDLVEVPIPLVRFMGLDFPVGGGGYFRLYPLPLFEALARRYLREQGYYLFYLHSWEVDPEQPRVKGVPKGYYLRHYFGLREAYMKLERFLRDMKDLGVKFSSIGEFVGPAVG